MKRLRSKEQREIGATAGIKSWRKRAPTTVVSPGNKTPLASHSETPVSITILI